MDSPPSSSASPSVPAAALEKGRFDGWVVGAGAVGLVGLVAGAYFGISAVSGAPGNPTTGPGGKTIDELQSDGRRAHQNAQVADVAFGVAIAGGVSAALLSFLRDKAGPPSAAALLRPARPPSLELRF